MGKRPFAPVALQLDRTPTYRLSDRRFCRPSFDTHTASPRAGISGWGTTRWSV